MSRAPSISGRQSLFSLLEEATHLLRRTPAGAWLVYVLSTLPFLLFLFFFLNDMTRSARAASHVTELAILLSLAYGLMKTGQALHAERLMALMEGREKREKMPLRGWLRLASSQLMIHATAPWVLVISAVILIPLPWTYAFYHNVTVLAASHFRAGGRTGGLVRLAWDQARFQWGLNAAMLGVLKVTALLVYLNVFAGFAMGAYLLKSLSGVENLFTMHWELFLSSPVQGFLFCLCYLAMNPFVKAIYVLRCFYGASRTTGADLAVRLRSLAKVPAALAALALLLLAGSLGAAVDPAQHPPLPPERGEELAGNIHDVLQGSEYQWRMPRESGGAAEDSSWLGGSLKELASWVGDFFDQIGNALGDFLDWLMGSRHEPSGPVMQGANATWLALMPKLLWGLLIVLILGSAWIFYRHWKQVKKTAEAEALDLPPEINLESEQVVASQLPENEWLRLAREKMESGELRLALRALFLASLAHLGEKRLLQISKTKSNGDYVREIALRARGRTELNHSFRQQVRIFDEVWYGWHEVTEDLMARFQQEHERITRHAT